MGQNMTELQQAHQQPHHCQIPVTEFLMLEERGVLRRNLKGDNEIALQMFIEISSQAWRAVWEEREGTCSNIYHVEVEAGIVGYQKPASL